MYRSTTTPVGARLAREEALERYVEFEAAIASKPA
ncbi:hypothetical protein PMI32_05435, partial [Pseudomonas sp. GM60]